MSAHAQIFQFQGESLGPRLRFRGGSDVQAAVDVHALWGTLLGAFSVFRLLTYFFLCVTSSQS